MRNLFPGLRAAHASIALLLSLLVVAGDALAQRTPILSPQPLPSDLTPKVLPGQCGEFVGFYGPIDYRTAHPNDKRLVEYNHWDTEYATFLKGRLSGKNKTGTGNVSAGFQYTLKTFPNHPTALLTMERLGTLLGTERPQDAEIPLECWYIRAFQLTPDDPVVRALYGIYLTNRGRKDEARHNLDIADKSLQDNANMQYNIGLMRFKLGQYEQAQINAMRASNLGFRLDALEKLLRKSGHWNPQLALPNDEEQIPSGDGKNSRLQSETIEQ